MDLYIRALYKILNNICEYRNDYVIGKSYPARDSSGIIRGSMSIDSDKNIIECYMLEEFFLSILDEASRYLLLRDISLSDFMVWLNDKGYLPSGIDKQLRPRGSIKFINGLPALVVYIKIDLDQLKSDTLNEEPEAKE